MLGTRFHAGEQPSSIRTPRREAAHGRKRLAGLLAALCLLTGAVGAQEERSPLEGLDTSSPRATLTSFLEEMHRAYEFARVEGRSLESAGEREATARRLLTCLDLREIPPAVRPSIGKEAAVHLKEVLDRIELSPQSEWPDLDEMERRGSDRWRIPRTEISITRLEEGPRAGGYVFSGDTVLRSAEFFELVADLDYVERDVTTPGLYDLLVSVPGWMIPTSLIPDWSRKRWRGQALWQWFGLTGVLLVGLGVMFAIYLVGRRRANLLQSNATRYLLTLAFPIAGLLVPVAVKYFVIEQLQIYGNLIVSVTFGLHVVFLLALVILIVSVGSRLAELLIATPWIQPAGLDAQLARLTCRLLSFVCAVLVLLEGGQQLGFSITTLVAGAGVSGLALALAAQDSLKNVLGGMMIMLDKPFRVGERIVAKGFDGTVEEIGLRSTKMRLLSGHQVTIPNEEMARAEIENVGRRPFIRGSSVIELPSNTPAAKIERALSILRGVLRDHEGMKPDLPPRVYLRDVNEGSLGISVTFWYHPPDHWRYLALAESVALRMSEEFEAEGIAYAAPGLTVELAQPDPPTKSPR